MKVPNRERGQWGGKRDRWRWGREMGVELGVRTISMNGG